MTKQNKTEVEGGPVAPTESKAGSGSTARKGQVVVATGKSICCAVPHGIKGPGDVVDPSMFTNGNDTITDLLGKGYLEKA